MSVARENENNKNPNRSEQVLKLYLSAIELESEIDRREYIEASCSHDPILADEVRALVAGYLEMESSDLPKVANPWQSVSANILKDPTAVGDNIGGFVLTEHLGSGSYGEVFKASSEGAECYAVKLLKKDHCLNPTSRERFKNEQEALKSLKHPTFASVYESGISDSGQPYFVMDYIDGHPLPKFCNDHILSVNERLQLFLQICNAIQHAHDHGRMHRDLKPEHILITQQSTRVTPHIIDFGIAKELARSSSLTQTGEPIGSVMYMSPEQIAGTRTIDHRSDIFSLGVILHELLSCENPFAADTKSGITYLANVIHESPTPPSASWKQNNRAEVANDLFGSSPKVLDKTLRGPIDRIVLKALEKSPDRRYQSAVEFAKAIEEHFTGSFLYRTREASIACMRKMAQPGGLPRRIALSVLLFIAIAAIVFYSTPGSRWWLRAQVAKFSPAHEYLEDCKLILRAETGAKIDIGNAETFIYEHSQRLLGEHFLTMWQNQREHVVESVNVSEHWITWEMPLSINWDKGPNKVNGKIGIRNSGLGPVAFDTKLRFAVSDSGSIQIGSQGDNVNEHLCILAVNSGLSNYQDFKGQTLTTHFPKELHDHIVDVDHRQNLFATWFAEVYAQLSEKGVAKYGPNNRQDLYACPLEILNAFEQGIVVTQGYIHHDQLDYGMIVENRRRIKELANSRWSPIAKNRDQNATLTLTTTFEYEDKLIASAWFINAVQDNENHTTFEINTLDDLPDSELANFDLFVGDPTEEYSSTLTVSKRKITGEASNVASAQALLFNQHVSDITLDAETNWSIVKPSFRVVTLGIPPNTNSRFSVSNGPNMEKAEYDLGLAQWELSPQKKSSE